MEHASDCTLSDSALSFILDPMFDAILRLQANEQAETGLIECREASRSVSKMTRLVILIKH